uniref:Uncharacterized protein n=1 Tax=Lactuca sativa TaxID=4236 RepID=A0A9R1ULH3_LACSA|nr:hypothetical protein LSAT_V11C800436830 [Lactuca sativa]
MDFFNFIIVFCNIETNILFVLVLLHILHTNPNSSPNKAFWFEEDNRLFFLRFFHHFYLSSFAYQNMGMEAISVLSVTHPIESKLTRLRTFCSHKNSHGRSSAQKGNHKNVGFYA